MVDDRWQMSIDYRLSTIGYRLSHDLARCDIVLGLLRGAVRLLPGSATRASGPSGGTPSARALPQRAGRAHPDAGTKPWRRAGALRARRWTMASDRAGRARGAGGLGD